MASSLTVTRAQGVEKAFEALMDKSAAYLIIGFYPGQIKAKQLGLPAMVEFLAEADRLLRDVRRLFEEVEMQHPEGALRAKHREGSRAGACQAAVGCGREADRKISCADDPAETDGSVADVDVWPNEISLHKGALIID